MRNTQLTSLSRNRLPAVVDRTPRVFKIDASATKWLSPGEIKELAELKKSYLKAHLDVATKGYLSVTGTGERGSYCESGSRTFYVSLFVDGKEVDGPYAIRDGATNVTESLRKHLETLEALTTLM